MCPSLPIICIFPLNLSWNFIIFFCSNFFFGFAGVVGFFGSRVASIPGAAEDEEQEPGTRFFNSQDGISASVTILSAVSCYVRSVSDAGSDMICLHRLDFKSSIFEKL